MLLRLAVSVIGFFCPQAGQARTFFIDKKVSKKSSHADPALPALALNAGHPGWPLR
jgi:hypothetical protein